MLLFGCLIEFLVFFEELVVIDSFNQGDFLSRKYVVTLIKSY